MIIENGGFEQPDRFGNLVFASPTREAIEQSRQFLERLPRPRVDAIHIFMRQNTGTSITDE